MTSCQEHFGIAAGRVPGVFDTGGRDRCLSLPNSMTREHDGRGDMDRADADFLSRTWHSAAAYSPSPDAAPLWCGDVAEKSVSASRIPG